MERPRLTLHRGPFPCHHLPLVGVAVCLHLRQPSSDALTRLWLLRCLLHYPHDRQYPDSIGLLRCALNRDEHSEHGHIGDPPY